MANIYSTYYLSELSFIIKTCNNPKIQFKNTCNPNIYTVILCLQDQVLLGTGTISSVNALSMDIQFKGTTNGSVLFNDDYTKGTLKIIEPSWQNPKTITTYYMNTKLTYL